MDASKAIALGLAGINYMVPSQEKATPLIMVATASGTGSELTPYAILTFDERKTKGSIPCKLFPQYSFVRPSYLKSVPAEQLVSMYFDIVCHAMESTLSVHQSEQ